MFKKKLISVFTAIILAPAFAGPAFAEYPEHPVTIIVPWAAGGGTDTITRIFAKSFQQELGAPVNVINRTGGSGVVGHMAIAHAQPDGYTLGTCTSEISYFKTMGLAPLTPKDFTLFSRIGLIAAGITVDADSSFKDLDDVLKTAKSDGITASGSGLGGPWQISIAGMFRAAAISLSRLKFIPSKGGAPALQDLVAGGIDVFSGSPVEAEALANAGEVRILAIMDSERSDVSPDVPTLKELGIDWTFSNWYSLCGPAGLPEDLKPRILEAARAAYHTESVQSTLKKLGVKPIFDGPKKFSAFIKGYAKRMEDVLTSLGLAK